MQKFGKNKNKYQLYLNSAKSVEFEENMHILQLYEKQNSTIHSHFITMLRKKLATRGIDFNVVANKK